MKRVVILGLFAGALSAVLLLPSLSARPAEAVIHEIVAAYCSGGGVGVIDENGELLPAPLVDFGSGTFAKPVIASGAVDLGTLTVTGKPNVKYQEGSSVFTLDSSNVDHPSADHCPKNALP